MFFDGTGSSWVLGSVIDAVADCLAYLNANEGGLFVTSREAGEVADGARRAVADRLGAADPDEVIFGPHMTT